jgi:hypothetical protein
MLSLRGADKMHHLGIGIENQFKKDYVVVNHYKVSLVEKESGEILSQQVTYVPRHHRVELRGLESLTF